MENHTECEKEEFELNGTLEGLIIILQKDFDMSQDEARFFVYVLINQDNTSNVDKKEVDDWYYNQGEKYAGQIFNSHYSLNFTNVKKALCHKAYIFLLDFFFCKGFDILQFGIELLYIICEAIKHIEDEDYCVFSKIIELNIGHKGVLFNTNDIITANKDQKCDYQDENWKCPYLREYDECINTKEKIALSFGRLEEKDVIKKVGNFWVLQ